MIPTLDERGALRFPIGGNKTCPEGGELIFTPLNWGDDRIRLTIRAYGSRPRPGFSRESHKDYSVVVRPAHLRAVADHFDELQVLIDSQETA